MKKFLIFLGVLCAPLISLAHVGYVVGPEELPLYMGNDGAFLWSALSDSYNVILTLVVLALFILVYWIAHHNYFIEKYLKKIRAKIETYYEFIPWILRLSLGIALIGAGSAHTLISPLLPQMPHFALMQVVLGFMMLAGFLLTPVLIFTIVLFLFALLQDAYLIGNIEFIFGAFALLILGNDRPGLDDILMIPVHKIESLKKYVPLVIRLGLGGAMIYLALFEKLFNPHISELVVTKFNLTSVIGVSPEMWVLAAGLIELLVGLFIFIGYHTRLTSAIAFLVITTTFFYFKEDVYSHVTLFGMLSVLFITGGGAMSADNRELTQASR